MKHIISLALLLAGIIAPCAQSSPYILYWGEDEYAGMSTTTTIDSISYRQHEGRWEMLLWKGGEEASVAMRGFDDMKFESVPEDVIIESALNSGQKLWVTPVGLFVRTNMNLIEHGYDVSMAEDSVMIYSPFDEYSGCAMTYQPDEYHMECDNEAAFVDYSTEGFVYRSLMSFDTAVEVSDSVPAGNAGNPYAGDELKAPLYSFVNALDGINPYHEIVKNIEDFKIVLATVPGGTCDEQTAAILASASKNAKKKKTGNHYSIYVQTGVAQVVDEFWARLRGHIRCATYRFNDGGEYGFLTAPDNWSKLTSPAVGATQQIRCSNQTHLRLSYDTIVPMGISASTGTDAYLRYRSYYTLTSKDENLYLKFPDAANQDISYGKERSISHKPCPSRLISNITITDGGWTKYDDQLGLLPGKITFRLAEDGNVDVVSHNWDNIWWCARYISVSGKNPTLVTFFSKRAENFTGNWFTTTFNGEVRLMIGLRGDFVYDDPEGGEFYSDGKSITLTLDLKRNGDTLETEVSSVSATYGSNAAGKIDDVTVDL